MFIDRSIQKRLKLRKNVMSLLKELKKFSVSRNYKYSAPGGASNLLLSRRFLAAIFGCALIAALVWSARFPRASAQSQPDQLPGVAELKKGDYENAIKLLTARLATNA